MSNSFSQLVQPLLSAAMIKYLATRKGFLDKVYIEPVQNVNPRLGGQSAIITLPAAQFTPTQVSTASAPTPQGITLPSATLTFSDTNWLEQVVNISDLEARVSRGNAPYIIMQTAKGMIDGLMSKVDVAVGALYGSAANSVGTGGSALTDVTMRAGVKKLADNKVQAEEGDTFYVGGTKGYFTDLMGIDRYVTPVNIGEIDNFSPIVTGRIPTLFNIGVDWSSNVTSTTLSGTTTEHGMLFNRYGIGLGFIDFPAIAGNAPNTQVQETFIVDPKTGLRIRSWYYLDPDLRQYVLKYDIWFATAVIDANRIVEVKA